MTSTPLRHLPGQITSIAWIYAVFGLAVFIACLTGAQIGPVPLSTIDALTPALLIISAVGAMFRRPWARWLCYVFSVLMLPGIPLGTIVGGRMIHQLTVHRDQFRRSPRTVNEVR